MSELTPIRREILVDASPQAAFEVFTAGIGRWWPVAELSVYGAGAEVGFSGGRIVERSPEGQSAAWGTVTRWEPPGCVAFTWHPGGDPEPASRVTVTFTAAGRQTLVRLEHAGWEAFADPAAARAEYEHGWPQVLDCYRGQAGQVTWVALLHRPGPAAPRDGSVFADPRFAEHAAFLRRMLAAGYLVAAGPLTDAGGEGMTILRIPGPGRLDRARELATTGDASVACGFFTVTVRPWQVMMDGTAGPAEPAGPTASQRAGQAG
jgi:uncharacterized protein YndB with AHSA1/START domain/uncharacterized protein YciI